MNGGEYQFIFDIANSLGTLGLLVVIVIAFVKGIIVPSSVQAKVEGVLDNVQTTVDTLRKEYEEKLAQANENRVKELIALYNQIITLLQQQIEALKEENKQQEIRTEQGIKMLTSYIDAQDKLSLLADHLGKGQQHE